MTAVEWSWHEACAHRALSLGGVIVHATEAVFGLAGRAYDFRAYLRIVELKRRPARKPFLIIAAEPGQLERLIDADTPYRNQAFESWPGPHTWVFPAHPSAPRWLVGADGTVAVRITGHPQARRLALMAGPLISTSANRNGRFASRSLLGARRTFGTQVSCYLPGQLGGLKRATEIRDSRTGRVLRS